MGPKTSNRAPPSPVDTAADDEVVGSGETLAPAPRPLEHAAGPLDAETLARVLAWWRAAIPAREDLQLAAEATALLPPFSER